MLHNLQTEAAIIGNDHLTRPVVLSADAVSGEVILDNGQAVVIAGGLNANDTKSGDKVNAIVAGPVRLKKATGVTITTPYWDISANTAIDTASKATGDFTVGIKIAGGASADDYVDVMFQNIAATVEGS